MTTTATTTISTPEQLDPTRHQRRAELDDICTAIASAYDRYAETDLEIGRLLRTVYEQELYQGCRIDGSDAWTDFLTYVYPDHTGGPALSHEEAMDLIHFAYIRDELLSQADLGNRPLPPTKAHAAALAATGEPELTARIWRIACDAAVLYGLPSVDQVKLAARLVQSEPLIPGQGRP